jgi:hypothetical protein
MSFLEKLSQFKSVFLLAGIVYRSPLFSQVFLLYTFCTLFAFIRLLLYLIFTTALSFYRQCPSRHQENLTRSEEMAALVLTALSISPVINDQEYRKSSNIFLFQRVNYLSSFTRSNVHFLVPG